MTKTVSLDTKGGPPINWTSLSEYAEKTLPVESLSTEKSGGVNLTETSIRGLGFKLKVNCSKCEMQQLQLTIGPNALRVSEDLDARRILIANLQVQQDTREARMFRRVVQKESQDVATSLEDLLYGPGIAD
ncbi:hypothetical protein ABEB36_011873 [Hypothenemus hampei]|uniref:Uncharacterized protein n=1 Tax=Hypothenemus hampei TaxID=57062 RepID=A0ABD1EBD5_HYPHA